MLNNTVKKQKQRVTYKQTKPRTQLFRNLEKDMQDSEEDLENSVRKIQEANTSI